MDTSIVNLSENRMGSRTPSDKINLRLILASGKSQEFTFAPSDSATDIAHYIFEHWPHEWADEAVPKAEILRLIYQGRFLHGNVTLGALQLPLGKTSVMHLVPRENLPEPNSQEQRQKCKERSNGCCNTVFELNVAEYNFYYLEGIESLYKKYSAIFISLECSGFISIVILLLRLIILEYFLKNMKSLYSKLR